MSETDINPGYREKIDALREAVEYRPWLAVLIVATSLVTAFLEGVGFGFLLPILQFAQSSATTPSSNGLLGVFVRAYEFVGVPLTFTSLVLGVAAVMSLRYVVSFLVGWLRATLSAGYEMELRRRVFDALTYAPIEYIDDEGSDELLNSLVTETQRAAGIVSAVVSLFETVLRGAIYLVVAVILSPTLTALALVGLGGSTLLVRYGLEPGYTFGKDVADLNGRIQSLSQSGIQGMRDVRLFTMRSEFSERMGDLLERYYTTNVRLSRNQSAMGNLNQLLNALVVFGIVYVGFEYTGLSFATIGVFLFAVFRLSPIVTTVNNTAYSLDGQLPHLVRLQSRLGELDGLRDRDAEGGRPVASVDRLAFEDVAFTYGTEDERVLHDVDFAVERGEKVALVGQSGAGKSTLVALLARLQSPDAGRITADGVPIEAFDVEEWRERLAVVRQSPYVFNETLWENVTIGNRDASRETVERACEIARVTEFLDDLPAGYETTLGEDGVRLSGGQKQRVAIARALVKDADVLVLDEATSELDTSIEREVYAGINAVEREYATISIAHRLSTVDDADRIYVLGEGTVSEVGTHDELLENGGVYADLHAAR